MKARHKYISTDVYIKPGQWKDQRVDGHPRTKELNLKIRNKFNPIEDFIFNEGEKFTFERYF